MLLLSVTQVFKLGELKECHIHVRKGCEGVRLTARRDSLDPTHASVISL